MWQDCVSGSSLVVSFENARTSFRRSSSFLFFWGRFRSNVSLRSHADNFLSFAGDKETLTRTGVADLSFGSTCHRGTSADEGDNF